MSEIKLNKKVIDLIGEYGHVKYQHKSDIVTLEVWQDLINAIKDWHADALAAKDARIAELESENSHLRHGMTGDYDLDAWLEWCAKKDATPPEDGREVDDFASVLRDEIQRVFDYGRQNYRGCMNETIEQLQVQHSRIVAAKDAEISKRDQAFDVINHTLNAVIEERDELRTQLDTQPARQVGGDEREYHCDYAGCSQKAHPGTSLCLEHHTPKARAALDPAAVVLPESTPCDVMDSTGNTEVDRIIGRLMSADPDF